MSFGEAISIAKEQKSVSLEKRAEATYAEYCRQKAVYSALRFVQHTAAKDSLQKQSPE